MSDIQIKKISITRIQADAVVNAANSRLQAGGGVCGYIFDAAGQKELAAEIAAAYPKGCDTGFAVITSSCNMKTCKYIIHAVGPVYQDGKHGEGEFLYDAYKHSLELAMENDCHSIAFPLISAGIFGYPLQGAWNKAIRASVNFLKKHPDYYMTIYFAVMDKHILSVGQETLESILEEDKSVVQRTNAKAQKRAAGHRPLNLVEVFEDTLEQFEKDDYLWNSTQEMKAGTVLYLPEFEANVVRKNEKSEGDNISVVPDTTFECARKLVEQDFYAHVGVLNFANCVSVGGGVTRGAVAQEECLCRCSNLYLGLDQSYLRKNYYNYNAKRGQTYGSDAIIYCPGVTVMKDDDYQPLEKSFKVDVLTCAAPCLYGAHISKRELERLHFQRGKNILEVAIANEVDYLILGAFGCGAFMNPPDLVAETYKELLVKYGYAQYFKEVVFAIKSDHNDIHGNYQAFKKVLG